MNLVQRGIRPILPVLVLSVALTGIVACGEASTTIRPSASLAEVQFTPRASRTPVTPVESLEPTEGPTFLAIPVGWDSAFCQLFGSVVIAQELIIDIERAIAEENVKDARGLARDLRDTASETTALLADVPVWDEAAALSEAIAGLSDLYTRAGDEYVATYAQESRAALRRARALRKQVTDATPGVNGMLADLSDLGVSCDDLALQLEQP
ncbi:MAG: hypothetical protein ABIP53_01655 [Candidatus Limnocylindrales bacterium]